MAVYDSGYQELKDKLLATIAVIDSILKPATQQVKTHPNPTGKGGFAEHPENRNPGGWRKEVSFSYQYKRFMAMGINELEAYAKLPKDKRLVVEDLAYSRVIAAKKSLNDVKEITDRTEGKAPQFIGLGGETEYKAALVEFIGDDGSSGQDQG